MSPTLLLRPCANPPAQITDPTVTGRSKILVVEDDPRIAGSVVSGLKQAGYEPSLATTGQMAIEAVERETPDLIVLDLGLPDTDGFELLHRWRERGLAPVVVLTARGELSDRLRAFELGAVDYVPKPFFMKELVARIATRLHEEVQRPSTEIRFAGVRLDPDGRTVHNEEEEVHLTKSEFNILRCLAANPGRAYSRGQLADISLRDQEAADDRVIDSHIARLRKKLGAAAAEHLVTVWGIGYRFEPDDQQA